VSSADGASGLTLLKREEFLIERASVKPLAGCSKRPEARRAKTDERRRTLLYVDAKSVECNEAYEAFSAVCYEP
jgi:hypothetical protein